jgi:ferredoxin--NADP+ reductase
MMVVDDKFYRAKVTKREEFASDLWMIRIQAGGEFTFAPGQYATLGVEHDGKRTERPYSIVSAPFENEIEFFFELVPEGALTPRLYKLQPGDELVMRKIPKGKFTLDTESGRKHHLLVSTVTGVAPFVSFVRTLSKDWKEGQFDGSHQLYLLNGASRPWEFGYKEELTRFAAELPWFKYVPTVSRPWDHSDWPGEIGRADDVLRKYADHWELDASNTTVVKAMYHAGRNEEHAARANFLIFFVGLKAGTSTDHIVNFILPVGPLQIGSARRQRVESGAHRGHTQKFQISIACVTLSLFKIGNRKQAGCGFGQADVSFGFDRFSLNSTNLLPRCLRRCRW